MYEIDFEEQWGTVIGDKRCLLFRLDTGTVFSAATEFMPVFRAWLRGDDEVTESLACELWSVPRYVAKDRIRSLDLRLRTPAAVAPADVEPEAWPSFVCNLNVGAPTSVSRRPPSASSVPRPKAPLKDVTLMTPSLGMDSWNFVLSGAQSETVLRFADAFVRAHGGAIRESTTLEAKRDLNDPVRPCIVLMTEAKRGQVGVVLSRRDPVEAMEKLLMTARSDSTLSALDAFRAVARLVFEAPCYALSAPLTAEGLNAAVSELRAWGQGEKQETSPR